MLLFQLPQALSRTLFSSLAGRIEHQRLGLSVRVIAAGAAITAAAGGLLFVLAQPLISILYGPAFLPAVAAFRVLLVGAFALLGA
jgi:O-antigen/teichoic acid export membrane protein